MRTKVLRKFKVNVYSIDVSAYNSHSNNILNKANNNLNRFLMGSKKVNGVVFFETLGEKLVIYTIGDSGDQDVAGLTGFGLRYHGLVDAEVVGVMGKYRRQHTFIPDCTYSYIQNQNNMF